MATVQVLDSQDQPIPAQFYSQMGLKPKIGANIIHLTSVYKKILSNQDIVFDALNGYYYGYSYVCKVIMISSVFQ